MFEIVSLPHPFRVLLPIPRGSAARLSDKDKAPSDLLLASSAFFAFHWFWLRTKAEN